jgi:hypothetical protein
MLLFADSFGLYSTLTQKYDAVNGAPTISVTNPRTGLQSMKTTTTQSVQKNIPFSQTVIAGIAVDVTASFSNFTILSFQDGGTVQVSIFCDGSGHLAAYRNLLGIGGSALLGTSTSAMSIGAYHYIEAKVLVSSTVGTIDIHVDGVSFLSLTAQNTQVTASPRIGSVVMGPLSFGVGMTAYWADYYICDTTGSVNNDFLGPTSILALLPTGDGTLTQWTIGGSAPAGTNWQSVNENPPDDGVTFVTDGTVGEIDRYTFPTIASVYPSIAIGTVSAVVVNMRAEMDTPGARSIRAAVISNTTVGTSPADLSLTTGWTDYQGMLETDPHTSAAWLVADINAAEFGQKVTV